MELDARSRYLSNRMRDFDICCVPGYKYMYILVLKCCSVSVKFGTTVSCCFGTILVYRDTQASPHNIMVMSEDVEQVLNRISFQLNTYPVKKQISTLVVFMCCRLTQ